jgi:soluble lytic murein transglycosylase
MTPFWGKTIRGRWFSRTERGLLALLLLAGVSSAQSLDSMVRAYREKPAPARRAELLRYAGAHPHDRDGALALLALGIGEYENKQTDEAVAHLRSARARLPVLADYAAYYAAAALYDAKDFRAAVQELGAAGGSLPPSPLAADAAMLRGRAALQLNAPADCIQALRDNYKRLAQPAGDLLLASCYSAANDLPSAVLYYQHVYFGYPAAPESAQASSALLELKSRMGAGYPPPMIASMLDRADQWVRAREYAKAQAEYEAIAAAAAGGDRDLARVRIAEVDYFRDRTTAAYAGLTALEVAGEADAERLYYLEESARRLTREDEMMDAVRALERYPQSPWRLRALVSAGNYYLLNNQTANYLPIFRACYQGFPSSPRAEYCHWKVVWNAYLERRPEAAELLREHLVKFADSEHGATSLYFLGRLAEDRNENGDAAAFYTAAARHFPNHYYADLARQRLEQPDIAVADPSDSAAAFLKTVPWPATERLAGFRANAATQARIDRAFLLNRAGLDDLTERELLFGARVDGQPHVLAMQLTQMLNKYDPPHRGLQLLKSLVPNYLAMPLEDAPAAFWRLLFPMPWRSALERMSRQQNLDPYVVAGLIRQESEFNPGAVSAAKAYGLTQVLPSTARALLRRRVRPSALVKPETNLQLGTTYLRKVYDGHSSRWELALAAYNAGATRVNRWLDWGNFREPAEFIETIPFTETRTYVLAVLRNAEMYRRLYGPGGPLADDDAEPAAKPAAPVKKTVAKKTAAKKRPTAKKTAAKKAPARKTVRPKKR